MLKVVIDNEGKAGAGQEEVVLSLDDLAREGARQMIMRALQEEVEDYITRHSQEHDERVLPVSVYELT